MPGSVKVGGAWKTVQNVSAKINGVWKEATAGYTKVAGVWKQWHDQGAYELIATIDLSSVGSAQFTNIPQTYKHLQIRASVVPNGTNTGSYYDSWAFNTDYNGANYNWHWIQTSQSSVSATYTSSGLSMSRVYYTSGTNNYSPAIFDIVDYTSTNKNKIIRGFVGSTGTGGYDTLYISSGLWKSTAAITEIIYNFGGTAFRSGSRISLYGLKG